MYFKESVRCEDKLQELAWFLPQSHKQGYGQR